MVIGITGGICCGKSTVSKIIGDKGYFVIDTDSRAKFIMNNDEEVKNKIIEYFGAQSYQSDGYLNSSFISKIVFDNDSHDSIEKLNSIVHPKVIDYMMEETQKCDEKGISPVFIESALIYEAGLEDGFDYIICVAANEEICIDRIMSRFDINRERAHNRFNSQLPIVEKRELSDFIIENNNTFDNLKSATEFILDIILNLN